MLNYISLVIVALLGIFGIIFNTKKDKDESSKIFNQLTGTGWITLLFIIISSLIGVAIKSSENSAKNREDSLKNSLAKHDKEWKDSLINYQNNIITKNDSLLKYQDIINGKNNTIIQSEKGNQQLLEDKTSFLQKQLTSSNIALNLLSAKNDSLTNTLSNQIEISYFSLLNQTLVNPYAKVYIKTNYEMENQGDTDIVKEWWSLENKIKYWKNYDIDKYFSRKARELFFRDYQKLCWKGLPSTDDSDEKKYGPSYALGNVKFNLENVWDADFIIYGDGTILSSSHLFGDEPGITNPSNRRNNLQIFENELIFQLIESKKLNGAILFNALKNATEIIEIDQVFDEKVPDDTIKKYIFNLAHNINDITVYIPLNREANLGFIMKPIFSRGWIYNDDHLLKVGQLFWKMDKEEAVK